LRSYRIHLAGSFKRDVKKLERRFRHIKNDVRTAISLLTKDPKVGVVIPGSSGMRKLRIPNRDQRRGKSGGYRLIYYVGSLGFCMGGPHLVVAARQSGDSPPGLGKDVGIEL